MSARNLFAEFNQVDEPTRRSERIANSEDLKKLTHKLFELGKNDKYHCKMISPQHTYVPGEKSYCKGKSPQYKKECETLQARSCRDNENCDFKHESRGVCKMENTFEIKTTNPVEYDCPICKDHIESDERWGFKCGHYGCPKCFTKHVTSRLFYCETCHNFATPNEEGKWDGKCYGIAHQGHAIDYTRTTAIECFMCRTPSDRCYVVVHPRE